MAAWLELTATGKLSAAAKLVLRIGENGQEPEQLKGVRANYFWVLGLTFVLLRLGRTRGLHAENRGEVINEQHKSQGKQRSCAGDHC